MYDAKAICADWNKSEFSKVNRQWLELIGFIC